jgi:hypothetical protein
VKVVKHKWLQVILGCKLWVPLFFYNSVELLLGLHVQVPRGKKEVISVENPEVFSRGAE